MLFRSVHGQQKELLVGEAPFSYAKAALVALGVLALLVALGALLA